MGLQFLARDQDSWSLNQAIENLQRLGLKPHTDALLAQLAVLAIEFERAELHHTRSAARNGSIWVRRHMGIPGGISVPADAALDCTVYRALLLWRIDDDFALHARVERAVIRNHRAG